ncbi:substrate-binding periplasmic protein [Marinobacter halodurans]|uniref:substrate-binding periplasmic protein n=1 Tax=Marinobacter halodurans TaxID=2528979 RepID=UPI0013F15645|nr:transporter substrate-binding domain-containing protein [Marinobacter halodurans]
MISLVLFAWLLPLCAETLTLVADYWCPFNCKPESDRPGFLIEVADRIFGRAGYTVIYVTRPWSRAIKEVETGQYTALVGTGRTEVPNLVFPKRPLAMARHTFFTRVDSPWQYRNDDSLATIRLGVIDDYSYGDLNDRYITPHRADRQRLMILNGQNVIGRFLDMLGLKRIDAFVEEEAVMRYFLAQSRHPTALRKAGIASREPLFIAFSPANPNARRYADILDNGLQALKESGELAELAGKYHIALKAHSP